MYIIFRVRNVFFFLAGDVVHLTSDTTDTVSLVGEDATPDSTKDSGWSVI